MPEDELQAALKRLSEEIACYQEWRAAIQGHVCGTVGNEKIIDELVQPNGMTTLKLHSGIVLCAGDRILVRVQRAHGTEWEYLHV